MSQGDDRGGPDKVPDFFLDEDFVAGARYTELSAAQRASEAAAEVRAVKEAEAARRKAAQREHRQQVLARRRPLISFALLILLGVLVWLLTGSDGESSAPAGPKQVEVFYAVPAGVTPDADPAPAIRNEIAVVQGWLKAETDRSLRFVDEGGQPGVTVKRLEVSAPRLAGRSDASSLVADEFRDAEGNSPTDTLLLVFVPVKLESQVRCGEASGAGMAIVWVGSCGQSPSADTKKFGEGSTLTIAHELVHALGAVKPCAPHYGNNGHVTDDPTDLMYDGGDGSRAVPEDIALDPGRDDYYATGKKGCDGIDRSRLWKK